MRILNTTLLLATAVVLTAAAPSASAQNPYHSLLGGGRTCNHVIDLLLRYGCGAHVGTNTHSLVQPTAFGPAILPNSEIGDLELISVTLISEGDGSCGPMFGVTIQNNSCRDVCNFHISLVAVFGNIHPLSPTTVQKVDKLCAGQAVEFQVSLPIEALSMGHNGGHALCYKSLVVAIDSYDQLLETDESNNLKVLQRVAIERRVIVETGTVSVTENTAPSIGGAPAASGPPPANGAPGSQSAPVETVPSTPSEVVPKSPVDDLDFNNLDLSEATAAVWRN